MAATGALFPMVFDSAFQKKIDIDTDTLKVMLLSSYTYAASHQYLSDVLAAGAEASGTGYTAGGASLASVTWTLSGSTYTLDAADVAWDASAGSLAAAWAVVYDSTPGTNATNPVIGYINLNGDGATKTASGAPFTITLNASGLLTFIAS